MANGRKGRRGQRAYTPKQVDALKEATIHQIRMGVSRRYAAAGAGYSHPTFLKWEAEDPVFAQKVQDAVEADLAETERCLTKIMRTGKGNSTAAFFKLVNRTLPHSKDGHWRHIQTREVQHSGTVGLDISVEQRVQGALERIEKQQAAIFEGRLGVDKALAAQHKAAKGGNGGNGGNGGGNGH